MSEQPTGQAPPPFAPDAQARLKALKEKRWPAEGREERIRRALEAWNGPQPTFQLTPEQWRMIAEDPDLEE